MTFKQVLLWVDAGFAVSPSTFLNSPGTFANTLRQQVVEVCLRWHVADQDSVRGGHDFGVCIRKQSNERDDEESCDRRWRRVNEKEYS